MIGFVIKLFFFWQKTDRLKKVNSRATVDLRTDEYINE